jgi:hypothetical protein
MEVQTKYSGFGPSTRITRNRLRRIDLANPSAADAQVACDQIGSFWADLLGAFPLTMVVQVQPVVPVFEDSTGVLITDLTIGTPELPLAGTGTGGVTQGSGLRINWKTADILEGRHVRGATFVVPSAQDVFDATGEPSATALAVVNAAANDLIVDLAALALELVIWVRPDTPESEAGSSHAVTSGLCSIRPSGLRRRRV